MDVAIKITVTVDTGEVYKLCRPIKHKACIALMRKEVATSLHLRATDDSGFWEYPYPERLAGLLIEEGLAGPI